MTPFPHFPHRRSLLLDGLWDFAWAGETDPDRLDPAALRFDETAAVPGVFDTGTARYGAHGVGVYRCRVHLPSPGARRLRLELGALGLRGRVWWDGRPLGDVEVPYSGCAFELDADGSRGHDLVIAVDNRFDSARSPLFPDFSDMYAHGGIYRSVVISELPALRVERVLATTLDLAGRVRLEVRLGGAVPAAVDLDLAFDDGPRERIHANPEDGLVVLERTVPGARVWSPAHPHLHTVTCALGDDVAIERFGVRTIAARDGRILLNGEAVRLKGVNRHEAHPQFGPVQPPQLLADDLAQIRDLGCNFIRAVHYPQDPRFLDLCDQLGLLVWEESLGWQLDATTLNTATTRHQLLLQTRHLVAEGRNHPSVIIWGFLNECASHEAASVDIYAELAGAVRHEDPSRLVSYASNHAEDDRCFALVDVVAVNLYPGWFHPRATAATPPEACIRPYLEAIAGIATRPGIAGKPMLVSEIGACALYGCHDRAHAQWSEEFQAGYMAEACRAVLADPRWSGVVLWQFCDTRSYINSGDVRGKPRGFNCAGLVDEYRRPKLAYDAVRAVFRATR